MSFPGKQKIPGPQQLKALSRDPEVRRFVVFLIIGGLNTLVGYGFFVALSWLGLVPTLAVIGATILGVLFNFMSTGRIVFGSRTIHVLPRFIAVYVVQCAANVAMLHSLLNVGLSLLVAEAIVLVVLAIATFFAMRKYVFPAAPQADGRDSLR